MPFRCPETADSAETLTTIGDCIEQLLEAVCDIADRDDIHQAADRLWRVQEWIRRETASAAADPIFASFELVS
jgi:hypothetical protein